MYSKKRNRNKNKKGGASAVHTDLNTILIDAIESDNITKIGDLIKKGADVNAYTEDGSTPLIIAIIKNRTDIVELLLKHSADPNKASSDRTKTTPLIIAIIENRTDIVKLLLDNGADPNKASRDGTTPLFAAVSFGQIDKNIEILKLLILSNPNILAETEGTTPLELLFKYDKNGFKDNLLESLNSDPNFKNILENIMKSLLSVRVGSAKLKRKKKTQKSKPKKQKRKNTKKKNKKSKKKKN